MKAFLDKNKNKDKLNARELAVVQSDLNSGRQISWLSEEKEPLLLNWFLLGKGTKDISDLTLIPESIVILTRLRYGWDEKRESLKNAGEIHHSRLLQDTTNTLFALTMLSIQKDFADVMSGKKDPRSLPYIPKNISQMKDLQEMVNEVNSTGEVPVPSPAVPSNNTFIQICQSEKQEVSSVEVKQIPKQSQLERMKALMEWVEPPIDTEKV